MFAQRSLLVPGACRTIYCLVEALRLLLANLRHWGDDVASIAVFVTHQLVIAATCVCKVGRGLSSTASTHVRSIDALGHSGLTSTSIYGLSRQRYRQAIIASLFSRVVGQDVLELGVQEDRVTVGPAGRANAYVASPGRSVAPAWRVGSHGSPTVLRSVCPLAARRHARGVGLITERRHSFYVAAHTPCATPFVGQAATDLALEDTVVSTAQHGCT